MPAARLLRQHLALVGLVLLGAIVRLLAMIAYPPALFFGDSWGYVVAAFSGHPVALSNIRPSGYPALLWLFTLPSRSLVQVVALQHLAGLAAGVLVYAAAVRFGVRRGLAVLAAALVLLDGYTIALEQHLMAEPFFTLTLLIAGLLVAWPAWGGRFSRRESVVVAVAGLLIGISVLERTAGLFIVPVFLIYLLWTQARWQAILAFVLAAALPVLAYAAAIDRKFGTFGLTQTQGWILYGRVAGFAQCGGAGISPAARPLCETPAMRRRHSSSPTFYIFSPRSPAVRLFGGYGKTIASERHSNAVLGAFARRILLHQPLDYIGAVAADVIRNFTPGATQFGDATSATSLPASVAGETILEDVRARWLPSTHARVQSPSALVRSYRRVIHLPRPLLALLVLASMACVWLRRGARREVLLFTGSGLALIIGSAATAGFGLRYLVSAVPLLTLGGALAAHDLWPRRLASVRTES